MTHDEFVKRMDEVLLRLYKREIYLETAKHQLLSLFREVVPTKRDTSDGRDIDQVIKEEHMMERPLAEVMIERCGWNACREQILKVLGEGRGE